MSNPTRRKFSFRGCACCNGAGLALSRRSLLGGATALGLGAVGSSVPPKRAMAQAPSQGVAAGEKAHRIDIHHHITPPKYLAEFGPKHELQRPSLEWTLAKSLDDMEKAGVATAITSVTTPGRIFAGSEGRRVARECNEYAAKLVADHRGVSACSPRCR